MSDVVASFVRVEGRVQGVGFRWHTRLEARALGLSGWVRNCEDGSVEAHVEGRPPDVAALVEWMRNGPSGARVEELEADDVSPTGDVGFVIR